MDAPTVRRVTWRDGGGASADRSPRPHVVARLRLRGCCRFRVIAREGEVLVADEGEGACAPCRAELERLCRTAGMRLSPLLAS